MSFYLLEVILLITTNINSDRHKLMLSQIQFSLYLTCSEKKLLTENHNFIIVKRFRNLITYPHISSRLFFSLTQSSQPDTIFIDIAFNCLKSPFRTIKIRNSQQYSRRSMVEPVCLSHSLVLRRISASYRGLSIQRRL